MVDQLTCHRGSELDNTYVYNPLLRRPFVCVFGDLDDFLFYDRSQYIYIMYNSAQELTRYDLVLSDVPLPFDRPENLPGGRQEA